MFIIFQALFYLCSFIIPNNYLRKMSFSSIYWLINVKVKKVVPGNLNCRIWVQFSLFFFSYRGHDTNHQCICVNLVCKLYWAPTVWRKVMTNLDSILKSRDITLPTKVHLVKAMVFPVVMYGYESWALKKAESQRIDALELWCWRRLLRFPWTARRSNQSIL